MEEKKEEFDLKLDKEKLKNDPSSLHIFIVIVIFFALIYFLLDMISYDKTINYGLPILSCVEFSDSCKSYVNEHWCQEGTLNNKNLFKECICDVKNCLLK